LVRQHFQLNFPTKRRRREEGSWRDCIEIEVNIGPSSGEQKKGGGRRLREVIKFEMALHVNNGGPHFVGLELRSGAKVPPGALADF
jgi:hypothetical protein